MKRCTWIMWSKTVELVTELTPLSPQRDIVLCFGLNVSQSIGLNHGGSITVTFAAIIQQQNTELHEQTDRHTHMQASSQSF